MAKSSQEIQRDAKSFVKKWQGRGKERQDDKTFWEDLLEDVFGVPKARNEIEVQKPVKFEGTTKNIDVYVKASKVVIEQKSLNVSLDRPEEQSDGAWLTPMQQGKRYYDWLDKPLTGRYIISCNFQEFRIFDTFHKTHPEQVIRLEELPKQWRRLKFLAEPYHREESEEKKEESVARTASEYVRQLYKELLKAVPSPAAEPYFRPWYGAEEFINRRPRYCLWLGDCTASEINAMPLCKQRVQAVIDYRLQSRSRETRELAHTPRRFHVENMPAGNYIIVPSTSSERRQYIPMGFMEPTSMGSNGVLLIPNATLYHFGVLESRIHMAWMRVVCGRLKSDYRYSEGIVYNNFPWPEGSEEQKAAVSRTAQGILDARAAEPEASLATLYDQASMPAALALAHRLNDRAVAALFQIDDQLSDEEIALELMRRSELLAARKVNKNKKNKQIQLKK